MKKIGLIIGIILFALMPSTAYAYSVENYPPYYIYSGSDSFGQANIDAYVNDRSFGIGRIYNDTMTFHYINSSFDKVLCFIENGYVYAWGFSSINNQSSLNFRGYDTIGVGNINGSVYTSSQQNQYVSASGIVFTKGVYLFKDRESFNNYVTNGDLSGVLATPTEEDAPSRLESPTFLADSLSIYNDYDIIRFYLTNNELDISNMGVGVYNAYIASMPKLAMTYTVNYHDTEGKTWVETDETINNAFGNPYILGEKTTTVQTWNRTSGQDAYIGHGTNYLSYMINFYWGDIARKLGGQNMIDKVVFKWFYVNEQGETISSVNEFTINANTGVYYERLENGSLDSGSLDDVGQSNTSSGVLPNNQFIGNAGTSDSSSWQYVLNGFGLFGDNGFFALMTQLFSFLPPIIVSIFTTMITITFGVIIYKLIRG